jgi:hypothetical protein
LLAALLARPRFGAVAVLRSAHTASISASYSLPSYARPASGRGTPAAPPRSVTRTAGRLAELSTAGGDDVRASTDPGHGGGTVWPLLAGLSLR